MNFVLIQLLCIFSCVLSETNFEDQGLLQEVDVVKRTIRECSTNRISCFLDKANKLLERAMNMDIPIFDGITFTRNSENITYSHITGRASRPWNQLVVTMKNFLNAHTLYVDLTEEGNHRQGRAGAGGGGLGGNKGLKKEKKYMQYAFMVLLGIFGLTGPLIMKTLAVMAAKALIASKMALIIVGSVALKKIFEKDHHEPSVKVHTIHADDDHDRIYSPNSYVTSPYWGYESSYVKHI